MLRISRPAAFAAGAVLGLSLLSASAASADDSRSGHDEGDVLRASITGSMTTDPVLFGVKPGGAPWVISRGEARLGGDGRLEVEVRGLIIPTLGTNPVPKISASVVCNGAVVAMTRSVAFSPKGNAEIAKFNFRPLETRPIFDGKTLDGWKPYAGDPKRERSKFEVTKEGELRVTDGPGDLQTTAKYADFLLSFECKTRGKNLNSGVFFRCLPGEYQAGYEAQIQNAYKDDDRTKPTDFGTGAIYRRVPARKVVSSDNEWFTMTVLAVGPTLRTWVNGEPVVSWTDDRPRDANARKGLRTAAGHLSIQGHDPTTDILFRNLRVLDLK